MMKRFRMIQCVIVAMIAASLGGVDAGAQSVDAAVGGEVVAKGPGVRFSVWGNWQGQELFIRNGRGKGTSPDDFFKLELLDMGYSPVLPFSRKAGLALFTQREAEDGTIEFIKMMDIRVPGDVKQPLVLLFPSEKGSPGCRVFDLAPDAFPYGGYQMVNLSKVPLIAKLDDKQQLLRPGGAKRFKGAVEDGQNVWLRVAAKGEDGNPKLVYSSMLKNRQAKRMFLFFYPEETGKMGVKALVDFQPSQEATL
ncbi:hypothetical protein [Sulfuriroseicoccus oceanibius]|uniref:Uncharacterized protein n=1 Tax=Sulfuriroseicoccus oceanibius TaxID=2707525 RepID=A0A6B3L462_9BACT|nr:hypothetical protein [Sulfuriroseicoccus oceanibius]QQL44871.1 hypothetical protein G3M56_013490 [Sulfuriroseicoccus oceanibius]